VTTAFICTGRVHAVVVPAGYAALARGAASARNAARLPGNWHA
jgi:hypothetical protein